MELKHSKYRITSDPGHIIIRLLPLNPIAKFYKFNDNVNIGLDEKNETVQIELKFKPCDAIKASGKKEIQLILNNKSGTKK